MPNSAGYKFYAGLKGSNIITVGKEDSVFNYTDIASAVAAAMPGDTIKIYPGTYTQTAILALNKNLTLIGIGGPYDILITSALTTSTMTINVPASHNAAVKINLVNIKVLNTSTGTAISIDNNGGAAQDLTVNIKDCIILNTSTGYALYNTHTAAANDIFLNISGAPNIHRIGKSYFGASKALSVTNVYGMKCEGAFSFDAAAAVAATFNMLKCIYASAAQTTGGNAANIKNYIGNVYGASYFSATCTKGAAGDFDAAGTEAAILYVTP
jgi:hypothetical protein